MTGPPVDLNGWRTALHKAAGIQPGDPDYAEAQAVKSEALLRIGDLARQGTIADAPQDPGAFASGMAGLAHGLSIGTGEPLAGLDRLHLQDFFNGTAGQKFREGAQDYRTGLANLEAGHPWAGYTGEMTGTVAPLATGPLTAVGRTLMGSAVPVTESVVPGTIARIARGAGTAAALGGVAGFSGGGEDPGDIPARFEAGAKNAALAAAIGGILSGAGTRLQTKGLDATNERLLLAERTRTEAARGRMYAARAAQAERAGAPPTPAPVPVDPNSAEAYAADPGVQALSREYLGRRATSQRWSANANANADADVAQADRDYAAGKITAEDQATAHSYAGRPMTAPAAEATKGVVPPAAAAGANPPAPPQPTPIAGTGTNALGGPQGLEVEGPPTPPVPSAPTVLETQEGQRYTPPGGTPKMPTDALPGLSPAQRTALGNFADKEIATQKEVMGRTQRGMTGAQAAFRMNLGAGAEPVKAVASLTRSPIFGQAEILANRIAGDPELQARFPEYQGLDAGAAKTLLLKQLVANAERGNAIPPLTSLADFLEGLRAK